jgi:hypothetical protein
VLSRAHPEKDQGVEGQWDEDVIVARNLLKVEKGHHPKTHEHCQFQEELNQLRHLLIIF